MKNYIITFLLGCLFTLGLIFGKNLWQKKEEERNTRNDYYLITNQIQKMNKLVVMEQDFSSIQKTKINTEILGGIFPKTEKEIIAFTKTNAQVSYDLNQMKLLVDSTRRKIVIQSLPQANIKIIPSVEIQSMNDSFLNRIKDTDIQKIQKRAKEYAIKQVDENQLRTEGRKQLLENLTQIFVLAKALDYNIEDQTGQILNEKRY